MSRVLEFSAREFVRGVRLTVLERLHWASKGVILCFHQVYGEDDHSREFNTGCSIPFLEAIIEALRHGEWDIVSLEDGMRRLGRGNASRRFAVLTFDDGYRDTLAHALPILDRHRAPCTAYVPTGAATRELDSWWLGLRTLFRTYDRVAIAGMGAVVECTGAEGKLAGYVAVKNWIHDDYRRVSQLAETFREYRISLTDLNHVHFMDEAELRVLGRHPLVTVGGHTTSHPALALLGAHEADREIRDNRAYLERLLERPVLHFAYPYGCPPAYGPRDVALAAQAGFLTGVTTRSGPLFATHRGRLHELPRLGIRGTASHLQQFARTLGDFRNAAAHHYADV